MNNKLTVVFIGLFIVFCGSIHAQDASLNALHEEAKKYMNDYRFSRAKEVYDKMLLLQPENPQYLYEAGVAVFKGSVNKANAIPYFEKAIENRTSKTDPELYYYMGKAYHYDHNFLFAMASFNLFTNFIGKGKAAKDLRKEVERLIIQCEEGRVQIEEASYLTFDQSDPNDPNTSKYYVDQNRFVELINLGTIINSKFSEYGGIFMNDNSTLVFTSRNERSAGGKMYYDDEYFEDIYVSHLGDSGWSEPQHIDQSEMFDGKIPNTPKHDATVTISADGNSFFYYNNNHVHVSDFEDGSWTIPNELSQDLDRPGSHVSSVALAPNGRRIYLVSDKAGGFGGRDIYYADMLENGKWGDMINCGPEINTDQNEMSPFMASDSVMYFSSEGHSSVGGYDIFVVKMVKGNWQEPVNLNLPINTPFNETDYKLSNDRTFVYYASDRSEGYGKFDIYQIKKGYNFKEDTTDLSLEEIILAEQLDEDGIYNDYDEEFEGDDDILAENEKGRIDKLKDSDEPQTNSKNIKGTALDKDKIVGYNADGTAQVLIDDEAFSDIVPTESDKANISKSKNLNNAEEDADGALNFIFEERAHFQFDRSYLTEYSSNRLNKVLDFIKEYPDADIYIKLSAHTDSKGSEEYNLKLSQKRAKTVEDYLKSIGVEIPMESDYYGESRPLIDDENDKDLAIRNRRVAVRVYVKSGSSL